MWKNNTRVNNKLHEHFGVNPEAIIKGPIKYEEIKNIYYYLGGPSNDTLEDEYVFFCFGNDLEDEINKKYEKLVLSSI